MTPEQDPIAAYLNQAAALLNLPIRPEDHADVLAAFHALRAQAQLLTDFPLPEATEPAPRFIP